MPSCKGRKSKYWQKTEDESISGVGGDYMRSIQKEKFEKEGFWVEAYREISGSDINESYVKTNYTPLEFLNSSGETGFDKYIDEMINLVNRHREKGFKLTNKEEELLVELAKKADENILDWYTPNLTGGSEKIYNKENYMEKLDKQGLINLTYSSHRKNSYLVSITGWGVAWLEKAGFDVEKIIISNN